MDFRLSQETETYRTELARWTDRRTIRAGYDPAEWREFADRGLLIEQQGESIIDTAVAFAEVARKGLPGPLLAARLASAADAEIAVMLADGRVITAVGVTDNPAAVGWGAVADMVVDDFGCVVHSGPLARMTTAYLHPHGWWPGSEPRVSTSMDDRRWVLGGALLAGQMRGAVDLTVSYVRTRVQFGRQIGGFQAVQFPLAEARMLCDGIRMMVLDAAWRVQTEQANRRAAAALLCVAAARASRQVAEVCHQAYGAAGLANEIGLNELTWGARWLRHEIGLDRALAVVQARQPGAASSPYPLVMEGFSGESPAEQGRSA